MKMKRKQPVICLDFDGVVHWNLSPWRGKAVIQDLPIAGAKEAIDELRSAGNIVVIHSGRCDSMEGRAAIQAWLDAHGIAVDGVPEHKPLAAVYVDDRAIPFFGDWSRALNDIYNFRHWHSAIRYRRSKTKM